MLTQGKLTINVFITGKATPDREQCQITAVDITDRKKIEKTLQENNLRLELAMQAANMAWWEMDITSGNVTFGKRKAEMLGYFPEKFKHYKDFMDLVHPDDFNKAMDAMQGHIDGAFEKYEVEYRILAKSGEYKWFYDIGSIVKRNLKGIPLNIAGLVFDISGRKQAEETSKEDAVQHRTILRTTMDGFWLADMQGYLIEVNETYCRMSGYSEQELLTMRITDLEAKESAIETANRIQLIQTEGEDRFETKQRRKDGSLFEVEVSVQFQPAAGGRLVAFLRDISDRKQAEEEVKKFQTAIENIEASIVITDSKGNIEYANPYFTQLTGYTRNEYIGKNPRVLSSGYHAKEFYTALWDTIQSGKTWNGEFYNRKKNGQFYWENAIISSVQNKKSEITHFVAIKTDISAAKKNIEELQKAKEHAEESDRLKSAFLANISHEIRTPMNGILGFAELLKTPDLTGEQQEDYFRIIKKSSERLLNTISNIVDMSKIDSGQMKVSLAETNINEQIEYVYNFFKPAAEDKGIQLLIITELPDEVASIISDRQKIYTILSSLIRNAIKYSDKGIIEIGYVTTGSIDELKSKTPLIEASELFRTEQSRSDEPVDLVFYVKDNGIGIPIDRQQAIFERFIQADISDIKAFQGAGLGLSISKAYLEMLGGKIWVESEPEIGSTFYFTIPYITKLNEKTKKESIVSGNTESELIKKLKILIVEDDETSEFLLSMAVKTVSKEVIKVTTGIEAIEVCRKNPDIDLVMMDIKLPGMDGYEATRQIRRFNKDMVIIAQTAYGLTNDCEKALEVGCNNYISKPINIDLLKGMIQTCCY